MLDIKEYYKNLKEAENKVEALQTYIKNTKEEILKTYCSSNEYSYFYRKDENYDITLYRLNKTDKNEEYIGGIRYEIRNIHTWSDIYDYYQTIMQVCPTAGVKTEDLIDFEVISEKEFIDYILNPFNKKYIIKPGHDDPDNRSLI